MVERWDNAETFAAAEVPRFSLVGLVVNDDGASDGARRCGIKVERSVVVLPGIHIWGYGGLMQEIKGEFSMRNYLLP